jgi:hypothetical protein
MHMYDNDRPVVEPWLACIGHLYYLRHSVPALRLYYSATEYLQGVAVPTERA